MFDIKNFTDSPFKNLQNKVSVFEYTGKRLHKCKNTKYSFNILPTYKDIVLKKTHKMAFPDLCLNEMFI